MFSDLDGRQSCVCFVWRQLTFDNRKEPFTCCEELRSIVWSYVNIDERDNRNKNDHAIIQRGYGTLFVIMPECSSWLLFPLPVLTMIRRRKVYSYMP